MDHRRRSTPKPAWRVDEDATTDEQRADPAPLPPPSAPAQGRTVFVDEDGRRRRLPADLASLSAGQRDAALTAMSQALGAPPMAQAKMAAIERLTELRAAGKISEAQFDKERTRLTNY